MTFTMLFAGIIGSAVVAVNMFSVIIDKYHHPILRRKI